jgi:PKHD-type hydroxylase
MSYNKREGNDHEPPRRFPRVAIGKVIAAKDSFAGENLRGTAQGSSGARLAQATVPKHRPAIRSDGAEQKMFLKIKNLLATAEIARLTTLSRELRFVSGRVSNPANITKDNLQVDHGDPKYAESVQIVSVAFARSREFVDFAMPKHVAPPLLCRYTPGMKYGAHADAALVHIGNSRLRSDLSCTVFINDPSAYDGGELSIVVGNQAIAFKGAAGDAIVYPSTALHEVMPVRSGERLVSITFIESHIADQHQRTQVYELNEIAALEGLSMKWENRVRLDVVRQNLMRMWSTT